jgi:ribosome-associated toxin RatA of RatAB toxin-antitoxin module
MQTIEISVEIPAGVPAAVFERLAHFERYPDLTDAVRSVVITVGPGAKLTSEWEVNFRQGILKWAEEDEIDFAHHVIRFTQTSGDLEHFSGEWRVDGRPWGCVVRFLASFDLGIPSLASMLDPIAERALRENVHQIIAGVIGRPGGELVELDSLEERAA